MTINIKVKEIRMRLSCDRGFHLFTVIYSLKNENVSMISTALNPKACNRTLCSSMDANKQFSGSAMIHEQLIKAKLSLKNISASAPSISVSNV